MAKKRKVKSRTATKAKTKAKTRRAASARRQSAKRKTAKPAASRAKKPARKRARKPAKPEGIGERLVHAVDAVLDTLTDAERLHARTTRKAGVQELE